MEERLLLHGFRLGRHDLAVNQGVEPAAAVLADAADADPAGAKNAPMGARDAAHAAGSDGIVERFAEQSLADIRLGFVTGPQVAYPQALRRLFTGEVGTNGRSERRVGIQGDRRRSSVGLGGARRVRLVFHQAL